MGAQIDVEGLAVALSVEAAAQLQMDERRTKAREASAAAIFWKATGIEGAQRTPRPPAQHRPGRGKTDR